MKVRWGSLYTGWAAFALMASVCLWYGKGQEVFALFAPHDDYYFLRRSVDWVLGGSHLAPIKEVLYPWFLKIPRFLGLGLRQFETVCYAAACYALWKQACGLAESRLAGWLAILPMLLFPYQHPVFNRVTYDALQLILIPLTFATSIAVVRQGASARSLGWAGVVAAGQAMTRPEGILFLIPPLLALALELRKLVRESGWIPSRAAMLKKGGLLLLIPVACLQVVNAANFIQFGFWSGTVVGTGPFQSSLRALMRIQPPETTIARYVPVPNDALKLAFEASPTFGRTRGFFEMNSGGRGWSHVWQPGAYQAPDGHLAGGHFQWALLDAASSVVGESPKAITAYFASVSTELRGALARGALPRRRTSPWFGPGFSAFSPAFAASLTRVGRTLLNFGSPPLPEPGRPSSAAACEAEYDRLALRQKVWVEDPSWAVSGWIVDKGLGLPDRVSLNDAALGAGISLNVVARPDVDRALFPDRARHPKPECGFRLLSPGPKKGDLVVEFSGQRTSIPVVTILDTPSDFMRGALQLHVDDQKLPRGRADLRDQTRVTRLAFGVMRGYMAVAALCAALALLWPGFLTASRRKALALVWMLALSVALPRLVLFAAIDSSLFCGTEARYLSTGVFSIWFLASFTVGLAASRLAPPAR